LEPLIENFEAQSGDGLCPLTDSTYISVINVTNVPEPEVSPVSSSPANVEFLQNQRQEAKAERKRVARATRTVTNSQTLEAVADLTSSINSQMSSGFDKIVQAIQAKSESASVPQTPLPSPLEGVNWTPIIQGLVSGLAASFGASVNLPTSAPAAPAATPAPAAENKNAPDFKFEVDEYNFGTIKQGESVNYDFNFTNTGKDPLIITEAHGSCGCTVPVWPKDPIKKGEKGQIKVTFNSTGKMGMQDKTVTITSNAKESSKVLHLKGNVETPPAAADPAVPEKK
jgi:hypothetical protein